MSAFGGKASSLRWPVNGCGLVTGSKSPPSVFTRKPNEKASARASLWLSRNRFKCRASDPCFMFVKGMKPRSLSIRGSASNSDKSDTSTRLDRSGMLPIRRLTEGLEASFQSVFAADPESYSMNALRQPAVCRGRESIRCQQNRCPSTCEEISRP